MTPAKPGILSGKLNLLIAAAGLLAVAPTAFAQQQPQILSVAFEASVVAAPLSDWLTAGIALLLAAMAIFALRRQTTRSGRVSGWMLALVAGAALMAATDQRIVSEAQAILPPAQISLTVSPGTQDVAPYLFTSPLTVTVANTTGQFARITSITLDAGFYSLSTPTTCTVGQTLAPSGTCAITLAAAPV